MLPITDETAQKVIDEWDIQGFTIPNAAYDWTDSDVNTVTVAAQLFVRKDADPQMVGDIASALIENADKLQGVHKAMAPLDVALMSAAKTVDYRPAAKEAFGAAGY